MTLLVVIWLLTSLASAGSYNFLLFTRDKRPAVRVFGAVTIFFLTPLLFPFYVFCHVIHHMQGDRQ